MGYTHYWTPAKVRTRDWNRAVAYMHRLFDAVDTICCEYDMPLTPPIANEDVIAFNGKQEQGHETFWVAARSQEWSFCKTAYKPYDRAVTAALIYLHSELGFDVTSDGEESDWRPGLLLAKEVWPEIADSLVIPHHVLNPED